MPLFDRNGLTLDGLTRDEYIELLKSNGYNGPSIDQALADNRCPGPEPARRTFLSQLLQRAQPCTHCQPERITT